MINEARARLILFSIIQPADPFWGYEINQRGGLSVYNRIISGNYYLKQQEILKLQQQVMQRQVKDLELEISKAGGVFITPEDNDWPISLADLATPPIGLVIAGDRSVLLKLDKSISIVGSRQPTNYGLQLSYSLASQASLAQLVVVSGGAYGIDTASHQGALSVGGLSIAVLAGGISRLYPLENQKLFKDITKSGLLISEVMPNTESKPYRFLIRNRLIAALSRSTVVVEAKFISGSIRTARDAAEIFRPVFAIPGPVTSPLSEGCHRLIAERVADIATSLDEILEVITPLQMR
ncbi:DNA processing protein [Candidatus Nanopelagicus abundans]|uniref:DNA processing protein n=1 Tax=Candidatus Nanopelagicus abundans TaxID=1884916 RepID=A0A249L4I4_9ACTN|nr:DNA-processing protein DprA [Candidatus Nanopelagicus abundans]ASY24010.1 DNA processing protein [Candidatus Nanopelagicus abundans]